MFSKKWPREPPASVNCGVTRIFRISPRFPCLIFKIHVRQAAGRGYSEIHLYMWNSPISLKNYPLSGGECRTQHVVYTLVCRKITKLLESHDIRVATFYTWHVNDPFKNSGNFDNFLMALKAIFRLQAGIKIMRKIRRKVRAITTIFK